MLRRYLKCEYRHWSTAPWFYTLVFSVVYILVGLSNGDYYANWKAVANVALPLLIILATMIAIVYWMREQSLGGTMSSLTMPVSRRDYITSKYVAVFLGQMFLALVVITFTIVSFNTKFPDIFLNVIISTLIALVIIAALSGLNFFLAITGRNSAIYIASGASAFLYHIIYYVLTERYSFHFIMPWVVIVISFCLITVAVIVATWIIANRVFINKKDVR